MRVGLFIPCYVDQFYPKVGIATLRLLEKFGCEVVYPPGQTCCGQPMANSGFGHLVSVNDLFIKTYPSIISFFLGSCVLHIKEHLHGSYAAPGAGAESAGADAAGGAAAAGSGHP